MSDSFWKGAIRQHNAVIVKKLEDAEKYPDRVVAFESRNFGWILSAKKESGFRTILLKY